VVAPSPAFCSSLALTISVCTRRMEALGLWLSLRVIAGAIWI
jgi:hypothetical protein